MAAPDLVIFDCDGVLIDSELIACRVDSECLTEAGFPVTPQDVQANSLGVSGALYFARLEAAHGRRLPDGFDATVQQRLATAFERELRPVAGIAAALERLDTRACVASSSSMERLRHTLGLTDLWSRFAPNVFSATMVRRGKPAPDLFLFAAAQMGADPARCLVIEDSAPGVTAAVAAGMHVFGFTGGSHCKADHAENLRAVGAHATFDDMRRLSALVAAS